MTPEEIRNRVKAINQEMTDSFDPSTFILNIHYLELLNELRDLRLQCPHEFKNGSCIYCQIEVEDKI